MRCCHWSLPEVLEFITFVLQLVVTQLWREAAQEALCRTEFRHFKCVSHSKADLLLQVWLRVESPVWNAKEGSVVLTI